MGDAERLARALGGRKSGNQWLARCPAHEDAKPSLLIFDGRTATQFRCQVGCHPLRVLEELRRRGLWNGVENRTASSFNEQAELAARRRREEHERARLQRRALALWGEAKPALGTVVETIYLGWWRGLLIALEDRERLLSEVIRLHRRCPRGRERVPAMVALMRTHEGDRPAAIHRTFFDRQWRKVGEPMMLGSAGGAAIKLFNGPPCRTLFIAEGIETSLALVVRAMADPSADAVWAAGSASAIERFPVIDGVDELVIAADRDANGRGERAAAQAVQRWHAAGKCARMIMSEDGMKDFAEGLKL
jgi:putative DNA primase/helicase